MSGQQDLRSIRQLFEALFPLNNSEREKYLASHVEFPTKVVDQTLELLRTGSCDDALPSLDEILPPRFTPHKEPQLGDMLGKYRLIRLLGSGGMGVVYEAVREEGDICLHTAIKLLHRDLCTPEFLVQMRREVSTLASLSHPNIARLFDWKLDQSDDSFFVLEYVEGEPLTKFCRNYLLGAHAVCDSFSMCARPFSTRTRTLSHISI